MPGPKTTAEDGLRALRDHVVERALIARDRYGEQIDAAALSEILRDREIVRFPTAIVFDEGVLEPGEFAFAAPVGEQPSDGFRLHVHPVFRGRDEVLPLLVAYHLVVINYGDIVTHEEAELFGATLLGMDTEAYYQELCILADEVSGGAASP